MAQLQLDHLVVTARTLRAGIDHVEDSLGVSMSPGGRHDRMGTHNALLSLGPVYLEVIAIDPDGTDPGRARWFGLDGFDGPPVLSHWVVRVPDPKAALARAPAGTGRAETMTRGDLTWTITIPEDGQQPYGGAFPGLIRWQGTDHPVERLPDVGCRLAAFEIGHPDPALAADLARLGAVPGVTIRHAPAPAMRAGIDTPGGLRTLR